MRWRQMINDDGTSTFVALDDTAVAIDRAKGIEIIVKGNFEPFKSMVDGSLISTQRDYDNHNKRNNVVNAAEFDDKHYADAAQKRADFYEGKRDKKQIFEDRQNIYDTMIRAERESGY